MKLNYTASVCEPIEISEKFTLRDAVVFRAGERVMLLSRRSGRTVLLSPDMWDGMLSGNIPEGTDLLLNQRCFFSDSPDEEDRLSIKPSFFLINLTDSCNLRCKYCFRDVHCTEKPNITRQEVIAICAKIVDYCKKNNVRKISIQPWGGEPLIAYDSIITIDEVMKKYDIEYQIVFATNATLITEQMAKEFKKRDFHVGLSLDGSEEIHDLQRPTKNGKQSSFALVEQGIAHLRRAGFDDLGVIGTVTSLNVGRVSEMLDTYVHRFGFRSVKLNLVKVNPFSQETYDIAVMDESTVSRFYDDLLERLIELNEGGEFVFERNIADKLQNLLALNNSNICISHGCLGGRKMVSFNRHGDVFPCELVDVAEVKMGNIHTQELTECIESAVGDNPFFAQREESKCKSCPWRVFCRGGCAASAVYSGCSGCDELECTVNRVLYPKLVELILSRPQTAQYLTGGYVKII